MRRQVVWLSLLASFASVATTGAQIIANARLEVTEGGVARVRGVIHQDNSGFFEIDFDSGDLRSMKVNRFVNVGLFEGLGFFIGHATAEINRDGQCQFVKGTCFVYAFVDETQFPSKELNLGFNPITNDEGLIVRRGIVSLGDIIVIPP